LRILFYLPVVTPWWFDNKIVPLVRKLAAVAEVHVMVAPLWRNTGIGPAQLAPCADLQHVHWHVLDGDGHPSLRTPGPHPEIVELVQSIDADFTICRSADTETPKSFPGRVTYIMEAAAPPVATSSKWIVFQPGLFDQGFLPELSDDERRRLDEELAPAWRNLHETLAGSDGELAELPSDRKVIALPLEYEHQENFFALHSLFPSNGDRVTTLVEAVDDDVFLAVTNHPLNERHIDNRPLHALMKSLSGRATLVNDSESGRATERLARQCDGMVVGNSKCFALAAFFGTPMLRQSSFRTAPWLNAHQDLAGFVEAVRSGECRGADEADARIWFAFHIANNIFDPADPDVDAEEIIDRLETPVDPARWDTGLRRFRQSRPELFA
jgi:hypothetical protein